MNVPQDDYLKALSEGHTATIQHVYQQIFPKVLTFVAQNKGQQSDADDVFQKALLQIVARYKLRGLSINTSFEAFLFTACKNLWRRELNKRKREVTTEGVKELVSEERDMALALLEQEKWELFQEKFKLLSENCRTVLKMYFNKVPYESIVKELGYRSDNVLRQRIFKCKAKLTELVKKDVRFHKLRNL